MGNDLAESRSVRGRGSHLRLGRHLQVALLVDQPIWAFHGADDDLVPVTCSRDMIAAIEAAGGSPLYTEYPTGGHMIWSRAYNEPELYEWMFAQSVPEPSALALLATGVWVSCSWHGDDVHHVFPSVPGTCYKHERRIG